jgi:hypothetical protein
MLPRGSSCFREFQSSSSGHVGPLRAPFVKIFVKCLSVTLRLTVCRVRRDTSRE